jgi:hypothetical protein
MPNGKRINPMKSVVSVCDNQNGIAIIIVVSVLALITLVGIMAARTTTTELQIATSDHIYKTSFYAAEAARAYVCINAVLYSSANIDSDVPVAFPDEDDAAAVQYLSDGSSQSFNGSVEYLDGTVPPRGSGFEVGKFKAHRYTMTCTGYGPRSSATQVEAGFYRIGF